MRHMHVEKLLGVMQLRLKICFLVGEASAGFSCHITDSEGLQQDESLKHRFRKMLEICTAGQSRVKAE